MGVSRGEKTVVVCSARGAANVGDSLNTVQQRDKLASTNFAFVIQ